MRCRTIGQNVPFRCCVDSSFCVFVAPLNIARASMAFSPISSSRSLLVQNQISSGMAFCMYRVYFWISSVVWALFIRAAARPMRYAVS